MAGAHAICSSLVQFQRCRSRDSELLLLLCLALLTQALTVCLCPSSAWRVSGCAAIQFRVHPSIRSFIRYSSHSSNPFPRNLKPNPHISSRGSERASPAALQLPLHHYYHHFHSLSADSLCDKTLAHNSALHLTPLRLECLLLLLAAPTAILSLVQCNSRADMALDCFSEVDTLT